MMHPKEILKKYWGYETFRSPQEDIIESILDKVDTIALLPTGGGKSVCFQIPALIVDGLCIVVTPLIALMKDQVEQLQRRGIPALAIFSGMNIREIDIALDRCVYDNIKFLYVSPERLKSELFLERSKKMKIGLLAIDEAHCISQWGYDFRPAYLQIAEFKKKIPPAPTIALTATATPDVVKDIQDKLELKDAKVFQISFARKNISYSCFHEQDKYKKLFNILNKVKGSSIVYVRSRKLTEEVTKFLTINKLSADYYHAGLEHEERALKQTKWIKNQSRIMVATNAFGMGIDKPDVRSVIHIDLPEAPEAYYQEAGRAGRDGLKSYAVVLFDDEDIQKLKDKFKDDHPEPDFIRKVYQALANYFKIAVGSSNLESYDFDLDSFQKIYNLPKKQTYSAIKKLEKEGFIVLNEAFYSPSKIFFLVDNKKLYDFQIRYEQYDEFIKIILRVYGGELFSRFIPIHEKALARTLNIQEEVVVKMLQFLDSSEILVYDQQKNKPQIIFTTPRKDASSLPLDIKSIEARKKNEWQKINFIINYATQDKRCRQQFILEYFGEASNEECGTCDICIQKRKNINELDKYDFFHPQILSLLKNAPLHLDKIIEIDPAKEKDILHVLRMMLEAEEINFDKISKMVSLNQ